MLIKQLGTGSKLSPREEDFIKPDSAKPAAESTDSLWLLADRERVKFMSAWGKGTTVPVEAQDISTLNIELEFGRFEA